MEKETVKRNDLKWEFVVPIVTWATYEKNELILWKSNSIQMKILKWHCTQLELNSITFRFLNSMKLDLHSIEKKWDAN